jgi:arylsulfatase A-like enzyme
LTDVLQPAGASFIKHLPLLDAKQIEHFDEWQRARLRALQAVDEMIDDLVTRIEDAGAMDNTYIVFSTDNGFHIGQYRMHPGKKCAYETDINIPLYIRGPGIPAGGSTAAVSSHVDLAPTFMKLAGQNLRADFDGAPIGLSQKDFDRKNHRIEHTQAEFWGATNVKGMGAQPNTYKASRVIGNGYNLQYTVWCTNEHELYDLDVSHLPSHSLHHWHLTNPLH